MVWSYGAPQSSLLSGAAFASRLPNGDTLIADANHDRVVEVTCGKHVELVFRTDKRTGSVADPNPTRAIRLRSSNTIMPNERTFFLAMVTTFTWSLRSAWQATPAGC